MKLAKWKWFKLTSFFTLCLFLSSSSGWAQMSIDQLAKSNEDLKKLIVELSQKVDTLESRLGQAERTGAVALPAAPEGEGMMRTPGGDIYLDGHADVSYNHNLATPGTPAGGTNATGNSTLRAFDRENDTFDLNAVQLNIYRPAPAAGGVGFRTEFTYGTDAQVIESTGFLGGTDELSIQEAFIELKAPIGSGLTVWAGKFATLHGSEVIENYLNWNASRSFLFTLAIPFTHTGVRAMYDWFDGKLKTCVGLVNGWDNAIDNNKIKDFEAMVKWIPSDTFSLASNFMIGSQIADDQGDNRGLIDLVATWIPLPNDLPKLSLMANYDYGFEEEARKNYAAATEGGPADWQGYALYAKYDFTDKLAGGIRFEQFWDDQAVRSGFNELWEMTYTLDYKVYEHLLTRLEYRHDAGNSSRIFDQGTENTQDTIGASMIYLFG